MGIFHKRREPRVDLTSSQSASALLRPAFGKAITRDRISDFSHKAPRLVATVRFIPAMATTIPDIPISKAPDPKTKPAEYLRSIHAVRERSKLVLQKAKQNQLNHFDVDLSKFQDTVDYVVSIIKRDFDDYNSIPPHGRWQHFEVGGRPRITQLLQSWPTEIDSQERTKRLIDLFLVSVLLDAGAGNQWSYKSKESGKVYARSEGLAVASLEMFKAGIFSSNLDQPHQVDAAGLARLTPAILAKGMQVSETNPMSGLDGRTGLLIRLSTALKNEELFGDDGRPGNMIGIAVYRTLEATLMQTDYLISHPDTQLQAVPIVPLPLLWSVLMDGLYSIWPATRTSVAGKPLGDAWVCECMPEGQEWEKITPFHKLTQWLCYSLMVPMTKLLNVHFAGADLMTGLPEYRNGGLLVDTGLLTLKATDRERGLETYHHQTASTGEAVEVVPTFEPSDDVIVEWRACTVGFLDDLLAAVNKGLHLEGSKKLSLPQMLEAGTWKGGRELAQVSRPITKGPPIGIISDGTVF